MVVEHFPFMWEGENSVTSAKLEAGGGHHICLVYVTKISLVLYKVQESYATAGRRGAEGVAAF